MTSTLHRPTPLLILDLDGTVRHGKDQLGRFVNGPGDVVIFPEAIEQMSDLGVSFQWAENWRHPG